MENNLFYFAWKVLGEKNELHSHFSVAATSIPGAISRGTDE
jgi:hypothetical protein